MPRIEFWYDYASTYSYLSALRIDEIAALHGVGIEWKPFLLGPIFKAQGWSTSPFEIYPNKGRHMIRDIERIGASRGLTFRLPAPFPQNSVKAARLGLIGAPEGWTPAFSREIFLLQFRDGRDISEDATLATALRAAGCDPEPMLARTQDQAIKDALRAQTERAAALGIFGAPAFVTEDGELFWGDDRLEHAIRWATEGPVMPVRTG